MNLVSFLRNANGTNVSNNIPAQDMPFVFEKFKIIEKFLFFLKKKINEPKQHNKNRKRKTIQDILLNDEATKILMVFHYSNKK